MSEEPIRIRFWGVRGSIPVPGPSTVRYGGNTSCIEVRIPPDAVLIFDAGTGIRGLGNALLKEGRAVRAHVLISHTHWDHIQGFPFFAPIYLPESEIHIYGPSLIDRSFRDVMSGQMEYTYFPVSMLVEDHNALPARIVFHELKEGLTELEGLKVKCQMMNHPVFNLGYRVEWGGKSFVYTGDNEPYYNVLHDGRSKTTTIIRRVDLAVSQMNSRVIEFVKGADLLIADAMYTPEEYESHRGWGHSTHQQVVELAKAAGVRHVVFFHHEPTRSDGELDRILESLRQEHGTTDFELSAAREGEEISLS